MGRKENRKGKLLTILTQVSCGYPLQGYTTTPYTTARPQLNGDLCLYSQIADPYSSALLDMGYLSISAYDDPRKLLLACMTSRHNAKIVTLTAHYRFTGSIYNFTLSLGKLHMCIQSPTNRRTYRRITLNLRQDVPS
ncbi:hypothetical protein KQX54_004048 [Cotesia glomerata]|uniref:Uncharacterized protein n=1 Tax=Cotesia glomerata TaxID=32391 RepID=A0AAV7I6U1_COTGL|nr:hypothetical protein KQX54_004048 [Cotesia glomerata]